MSLLADLLAAKEPLFEHALQQMEERTGRKGIDAALAAEIRQKTSERSAELGIHETDGQEALYRALLGRIKNDDERLCRLIGGDDPTDLAALTPLIIKTLEAQAIPKTGWFMKAAKAKQLLESMPPKGIMKLLGYESVKQLIQKEDIFQLFCALRFCETPDWLNKFDAAYTKKLKPTDFENRAIKIVVFEAERWSEVAAPFIAKKLHNITHSKEMGAICVLPVGAVHTPGVTIKIMPLICHYFNEIRLYSSFFKLVKNRPDFGKVVADTLVAKPPSVKVSAHAEISWKVIQRYFGKLKHEHHPEIFEPHLQPEDLHWRKAEEVLYSIDPELEFWQDMDFVASLKEGKDVSFNLMDVSLGYANQLAFGDRYNYHFRESLWNEIFARYFGEAALQQQVLEHLDNEVINPSKV